MPSYVYIIATRDPQMGEPWDTEDAIFRDAQEATKEAQWYETAGLDVKVIEVDLEETIEEPLP